MRQTWTRTTITAGLTILALLLVGDPGSPAEAAGALPGTGASRVILIGSQAPDGGVVSLGRTTGTLTHSPMCFTATGAVEVSSATVGATSVAVLSPDQWYEVYAQGDLSGATAACWDDSAAITSVVMCGANDAGCYVDAGATCYAKPKLKDGMAKPLAWEGGVYCQTDAGCAANPGDDAGGITCRADVGCVAAVKLNVFVTTPGAVVTLTPESPCQ